MSTGFSTTSVDEARSIVLSIPHYTAAPARLTYLSRRKVFPGPVAKMLRVETASIGSVVQNHQTRRSCPGCLLTSVFSRRGYGLLVSFLQLSLPVLVPATGLIGERTALINQLRGILLERGIALPQGRPKLAHGLGHRFLRWHSWSSFSD